MPDRDAYTKLGYEVDEGSISKAIQRVEAVRAALNKTRDDLPKLASEAKKSGDVLVEAYTKAQKSADNAARSIEKVTKASKQSLTLGSAENIAQRTGSALRGLGAGGAGDVVSGVADVLQLGSTLQEAAKGAGLLQAGAAQIAVAGPLAAGALVAMGLSIDHFNKSLDSGKKSLAQAVSSLDAYYKAIETGTQLSIQRSVQDLKRKQALEQQEYDAIKNARDNAFKSEQKNFGGDARARALTFVGDLTGAFAPVTDRTKELEKSLVTTAGQINGLESALKSTEVAANTAAQAEQKLADARLANIDAEIALELKIAAMRRSGATTKQYEDEAAATAATIRALRDRIPQLEKEAESNEAASVKLETMRKKIEDLTKDLQAFNDEAARTKAFDIIKNFFKGTGDAISKGLKPVTDAIAKSVQDVIDRDARLIDVQTKYNSAVIQLDEQTAEKRAGILEKYNDAIVDAAQKAVDDATKALDQLEQRQKEARLSLTRDNEKEAREAGDAELEIQIKTRRAERDDLVEHLRRVKEIRDGDKAAEQAALLDRNFLSLYKMRQAKAQELEQENTGYLERKQDRQQEAQDERNDDTMQRGIARRERLISYEQQLADAREAYRLDLDNARIAKNVALRMADEQRNTELRKLNEKYAAETALLESRYKADIKIANLYGAEYLKVKKAQEDAVLKQAKDTLRLLQGGGSTGYVSRSDAVRDRASAVAPRSGFAPAIAPSGSRSSTSVTRSEQSNTFYITSHDPQGVRQEVMSVLKQVIA